MVKAFKTLNEQIAFLETSKNIIFDDKEKAKQYLLNQNYYNVISTGKICYFQNKITQYSSQNFENWKKYYEKDVALSKYLFTLVVDIEKMLNSRFAYYLSLMLEENLLDTHQRNYLKFQLGEKFSDYDFKETWVYITQSTFGKVVHLINYFLRSKNDKIRDKMIQVCAGFEDFNLHELVNLRNNLFHLTPLNIYLTGGYFPERRKTVQLIFRQRYNISLQRNLQETLAYCQKYKQKRDQRN